VKVGLAKATVDASSTYALGPAGAGGRGNAGGYAPNGEKRSELAL